MLMTNWKHLESTLMYSEKRKDLKYYEKSLQIIEAIKDANSSKSIIDIGGWGGAFVNRTTLDKKVCLDIRNRKALDVSEDVTVIIDDFLKWNIQRHDIACCMQVLEHISDEYVEEFAEKLFKVADHVIISVPYRWKKGFCKYHKQDPINYTKLKVWVKRDPTESHIIKDKDKAKRLICYYNLEGE